MTNDQVVAELNSNFGTKGMSATELAAAVKAWQSGAISQDTMLDLFCHGANLPEGRTNDEEKALGGRAKDVNIKNWMIRL